MIMASFLACCNASSVACLSDFFLVNIESCAVSVLADAWNEAPYSYVNAIAVSLINIYCTGNALLHMGIDHGGTRGTSPPEFGVRGR